MGKHVLPVIPAVPKPQMIALRSLNHSLFELELRLLNYGNPVSMRFDVYQALDLS